MSICMSECGGISGSLVLAAKSLFHEEDEPLSCESRAYQFACVRMWWISGQFVVAVR